jgi:hypothetical protein
MSVAADNFTNHQVELVDAEAYFSTYIRSKISKPHFFSRIIYVERICGRRGRILDAGKSGMQTFAARRPNVRLLHIHYKLVLDYRLDTKHRSQMTEYDVSKLSPVLSPTSNLSINFVSGHPTCLNTSIPIAIRPQ